MPSSGTITSTVAAGIFSRGITVAASSAERKVKALEILAERYPFYNPVVAEHIQSDPASSCRFAAMLQTGRVQHYIAFSALVAALIAAAIYILGGHWI